MREDNNMNKEISISKGNMKLGSIWNVSLPPGKSCGKNLPCFEKCYARKAYRQYPATKAAWDKNYELYKQDPGKYFRLIDEFLAMKKPTHFRFHVAGDIPDMGYYLKLLELVDSHTDTKFLVFTKKFDILQQAKSSYIRDNLSIVLSAWPNMPMDKELQNKYPVAWMEDPKNYDSRIPKDKDKVFYCTSNCQTCNKNKGKTCWELARLKKDVVFKVH